MRDLQSYVNTCLKEVEEVGIKHRLNAQMNLHVVIVVENRNYFKKH